MSYSARLRRSEEHTSELQSLRHLVCRLLLEKKNSTQARGSPARPRSRRPRPLLAGAGGRAGGGGPAPHGCRWRARISAVWLFFFFNDTATTEIYTLSLHDALPI